MSWTITKKTLSTSIGIGGPAYIFEAATGGLTALATKIPSTFGWLKQVLTLLGL